MLLRTSLEIHLKMYPKTNWLPIALISVGETDLKV